MTPALSRLGRYQLFRVLGQGAMGIVYEGLDPLLNRQVAIKTILRSALVDTDTLADSSTRFVREAQAVARLNHPNIVTVFDFGEEGDVAYFVMEFVRGRELKAYFDSGELFDLGESVRIVCELLAALDFAHQQGVVHRDVKPANVMLDTERRVKLTDFGVARLADSSSDRTMAGTMVGTPSYMSPEQIQGLSVGSRTDLFAVGVILYQCLATTRPFLGPGAWAIQKQIVQDDPLPPSVVNPKIPTLFNEIVARALAKDSAQRYASAAEFATDLKRALALVEAAPGDELATLPVTSAIESRPTKFPKPLKSKSENTPLGDAKDSDVDEDSTRIAALPPETIPTPSVVSSRPAKSSQGRGHSVSRLVAAGLIAAVTATVFLNLPMRSPVPTGVLVAKPKAPAEVATTITPTPIGESAASLPPTVATVAPVETPPPLPIHIEAAQKEPKPESPARTSLARRLTTSEVASKSRVATGKSQSSTRCDDLMQRFQIGEDLPSADLVVLQKECRK